MQLLDFFQLFEDSGKTKEIHYVKFSPLGAGESETKSIWFYNRSGFLLKGVRLSIDIPNQEIVKIFPPVIPLIKIGELIKVDIIWTCTKEQQEPLQAKVNISGSFIKPALLP